MSHAERIGLAVSLSDRLGADGDPSGPTADLSNRRTRRSRCASAAIADARVHAALTSSYDKER